jgi:O-antigen ligase
MALIGFVVALLVHRTTLRVLAEKPVRAILLAFAAILIAIVLSAIHAAHLDAVGREFLKWIEYGAVFAAVAVGFSFDPDDRPVWTALIAIGLFEVAAAGSELLFGAASGVVIAGHNVPRVAGTIEGPNQFAAWLNLLLPVLFARMLADRNPWLIVSVALCTVTEVATLSRSGIVAALAAGAVVLLVTRPSRNVGLGFAAGAAVVAAILVTLGLSIGLEARFFSVAEVPQPDHLGTRAILWKAALDLWRSSPIVGVGAGNFEYDLGLVGHPEVHTHANSLYLQALSEMGLVGFAATLYLIWTVITTFARSFSRRPLLIGVFAANIALALHQIFDYLWFFPKVGIFWAILLAIGAVEVLAARDDVGRVPEVT